MPLTDNGKLCEVSAVLADDRNKAAHAKVRHPRGVERHHAGRLWHRSTLVRLHTSTHSHLDANYGANGDAFDALRENEIDCSLPPGGGEKWKPVSVQAEAGVGVPDFARTDELDARHRHRVQLAFDVAAPEIEEAVQHRKIRCEIHVLPDEALQDARVIGKVIKNFCRGQAIVAKLQMQVAHGTTLVMALHPIRLRSR
jgi:hypothetical protein